MVASDPSLKALTVFFQTFGFLAVAPFEVPLLASLGSQIILILRFLLLNLFLGVLKFHLSGLLLKCRLIAVLLLVFLTRILLTTLGIIFVRLGGDFRPKRLRVPFQNVRDRLSSLLFIFTVVFTV